MSKQAVRPPSARPLQAAFGINLLGNAVGSCGLPVVALAVTGDIAVAGIAVAMAVIGATVSGLLSGPIIDRIGARPAWIFSILAGSSLGTLTVLLWWWDLLAPAAFVALCGLRSFVEEPGRIATYGWMPELARRSGMRLERANAIVRLFNSVAQITGPVGAGLVLFLAHPILTIGVDATLGFVAAAIVIRSRLARGTVRDTRSARRERTDSYRRTFGAALKVLTRDPLLISMTVAMAVFAALDTSLATVGLTSYSADILGDVNWYSVLLFAFGLGGLLGVGLYTLIGHKFPRRAAFLAGYIGVAALSGLLAWGVSLQVAIVLVILVGVLTSPIDLIYLISLQERVPPALLNSVTGVATTIVSAPSPLLIPIVAAMLAEAGPQLTFLVLAGTYAITLALCWLVPASRGPHEFTPMEPDLGPEAERLPTPPAENTVAGKGDQR